MEEIRSQIKSYSDQKTYYTHVTDVLRRYISKRYKFNALEMTSSEILDKLHDECKETDIKELEENFQYCRSRKVRKIPKRVKMIRTTISIM